jgi:hypothetical protein
MKVFVLTYPCGEGPLKCFGKSWQTEVHETREAVYKAAEGRMFIKIVECEVGASWQSRTRTWTKPEPLEIEKTLENERQRCDTFESEVYRINGRLAEEKAKVAALEEQIKKLGME